MKNFGGGKRPFKAKFTGPKGASKAQRKDSKKQPTIKNQVRGLERLLRLGPDRLDPKIKAKKVEELQELKKQLVDHKQQELEKKYALRYHHARFFERVKIERSISKLQRKAAPGSGDSEPPLTPKEQQRLEQLKADLQYVIHFPKGEKWVSLLKNAEEPEAQAHLEAERARLRQLVQQQLQEQAAVTEGDEGRAMMRGAKVAVPGLVGSKRKAADAGRDGGADVEEEDDFFLGVSDEEQEEKSTKPVKAVVGSGKAAGGQSSKQLVDSEGEEEEEAEEEEEEEEGSEAEEGEEQGASDGEEEAGPSGRGGLKETGTRRDGVGRRQGAEERSGHAASRGGRGEGRGGGRGGRGGSFGGTAGGRGRGQGGGGRGGPWHGAGRGAGRGESGEQKISSWSGQGGKAQGSREGGSRGAAGQGRGGKAGGRGKGKKADALPVRKREEGGRKRRK